MVTHGEVPRSKRQRDDISSSVSDDSDSALLCRGSTRKPTSKRSKTTQHATSSTTQQVISSASNINPGDPDQPRSPFYHPLRSSLEELVTEVIDEVTRALHRQAKPGYHDSELKSVITKLQKYAVPSTNYEASKPIAFIGRAGVGKSLTLSCVIDQPGISLDSKDPVRGTNLTHEYSAFDEDCEDADEEAVRPKYKASAVYFTEDEITAKVKEICVEAFKFLDACDDEVAETQDPAYDGVNNEDPTTGPRRLNTEEGGQRYSSGIEYLVTMLCSEPEFRNREDINVYFKKKHILHKKTPGSEEVLDQTVGHLMTRITELLATRINSRDAKDLGELQQAYREMSKPDLASKGHPWRAMEKLSVSVDHQLLQAGAILGDTPGLSDSDMNVADGMRRYAQRAGALVLCTTFARSDADSVLDQALALAVQFNKQRSTFLILTMIDELRPERTKEEKSTLQHCPEDAAAIESAELEKMRLVADQRSLAVEKERLIDEKKACQNKQSELMTCPDLDPALFEEVRRIMIRVKELDAAMDATQAKVEEMPARIGKIQKKIEELERVSYNKIDQAYIQALNRNLRQTYEGKIRAYTKNPRDPDLPVIFVSAKQYKKHLEGCVGPDGPFLDREATGLPTVKRLAYGLATASHFAKLKDIALQHTPRLIKSAITLLSKKPLAKMEQIRLGIESHIEHGMRQILEHFSTGINNAFETHTETLFDDEGNIQTWMTKAERLARDLPGNHHSIVFRNFCNKNGNWICRGQKCFWNRSIIEIYSSTVNPACEAFQAECEIVKTKTLDHLTGFFDGLRTSIADGPYKGADGYDDFFEIVQETQDELSPKLEASVKLWLEKLSTIRNNLVLFNELTPGPYVAQAMCCSYEKAAAITFRDYTGSGASKVAHRARVAIVEGSILGTVGATEPPLPNIFEAVRKLASKDLSKKSAAITRKLQKLLKSDITDRLMQDFDHRYGVGPIGADGTPESTIKMLKTLRGGLKRLEHSKTLVAECEKWKVPGGGLI